MRSLNSMRLRVERWKTKEEAGAYMRPILHVYFIWDPVLHHRIIGKPLKPKGEIFSLSAHKCIERSRQEHQELLAEFESLLRGVETALQAAELGRAATHGSRTVSRSSSVPSILLHLTDAPIAAREEQLRYSSAREQMADVSIVDETDAISESRRHSVLICQPEGTAGRDLPWSIAGANRS